MTNMEHVTDITIALLENIGDPMYWALKKRFVDRYLLPYYNNKNR